MPAVGRLGHRHIDSRTHLKSELVPGCGRGEGRGAKNDRASGAKLLDWLGGRPAKPGGSRSAGALRARHGRGEAARCLRGKRAGQVPPPEEEGSEGGSTIGRSGVVRP